MSRYRVNKIKRMHSIVQGLLPVLETVAQCPNVSAITPGRISAASRVAPSMTVQYFTESGLKLIARTTTAVQEVFVVTQDPQAVCEWLREKGIVAEMPQEERAAKPPCGTSVRSPVSRPSGPKARHPRARPAQRRISPGVSHDEVPESEEVPPVTIREQLDADTRRKLRNLLKAFEPPRKGF